VARGRARLCELPFPTAKLLVEEEVKLRLSSERGTLATVYPLEVTRTVIEKLELKRDTGPERDLVVRIILEDLKEVVDLKGRIWKQCGYKAPFSKGGTQDRYRVFYARADLRQSELAKKMPVECPLHPSKKCGLSSVAAEGV